MKKRIFTSFAIEDENSRNLFIGQAKNENSPFECIDMSVKEPWDSQWKTNCRDRIKSCSGVIALISANTVNAKGQLWEIQCAKEEKIPIIGIYINNSNKYYRLLQLIGIEIVEWSWDNIKNFINSL